MILITLLKVKVKIDQLIITNDKTFEVKIEGKNNASGQTNHIDVKIKNS